MKKIFIVISFFMAGAVQAQRNYFYVNWDINTPTSSTKWISSTSTSGVRLGYRVFLNNEKISLGLDIGKGTFSQYEPKHTFQSGNGAITTDYFKYIYTFSVAASGQYYFKMGDNDKFYPYAGLGLGANNNDYTMYYNIYKDNDTNWGFLARPEAGIIARVGRTLGLMAAVHYDYSTNKSDYFEYKNFSAFGVQVGIAVMSRR
jgi:outer membrane protein W